jgi:hypothetical protein
MDVSKRKVRVEWMWQSFHHPFKSINRQCSFRFFCSIALVFSTTTTTLASSNILKTRTTLKRVKMDEGVFELWQDMAFQAKASSNKIAIL